jgi:hypothetical protein
MAFLTQGCKLFFQHDPAIGQEFEPVGGLLKFLQ